MPGIWDIFGNAGQTDERRDESHRKRTVVKDGDETRVLGGVSVQEHREGQSGAIEEDYHLIMADDGKITTTDPQDSRYPHIAGKDYLGNMVSEGNLNRCMEKGCNRMVSNLSGVEYEPGQWRCTQHYKIHDLKQFLKMLISPFLRQTKEEKPQIPQTPSLVKHYEQRQRKTEE